MSQVGISVQQLTIGYGSKVIQRDMSFTLYRGEMVCMLGPNGVGKSTLLRTLSGLQPALSGETSVSALTRTERAKQLSLVLTERVSVESTTVWDVVAMGRYPYTSFLGVLTDTDKEQISEALNAVEMTDYASRPFLSLSDGESQRVLIAKALAQQTPCILLDEPTAHLDLPNRLRVMRLLHRLAHEQQKTILISTHELDLALALADRILLLSPQGMQLDTAQHLIDTNAFTPAFGMDIFHPLA
ncbi:MAG: ABC transporter ATP-binding protein [Paludibacteraceae bacterium]|nr:ABC transporter ATP-binding protein [Paludibacteraceae bacterium]